MEIEAYAASGIERKKIETLFGEAKHILALTRLRLRGLSGARDEFLLTATVQNLKRLARNTTIPEHSTETFGGLWATEQRSDTWWVLRCALLSRDWRRTFQTNRAFPRSNPRWSRYQANSALR